jgi:hypothetical protein
MSARRACVFNFLSSQQKVKRNIPLRSLRLERKRAVKPNTNYNKQK